MAFTSFMLSEMWDGLIGSCHCVLFECSFCRKFVLTDDRVAEKISDLAVLLAFTT